jgi:hypothetical protein
MNCLLQGEIKTKQMEDLAEMSLTIGNMKKGGRSPFLSVIL